MNDVPHTIHDVIKRQLHQQDYDVIAIVPVPHHSDRMVRLRTLEEMLEENSSNQPGVLEYLIQVKPKRSQPVATLKTEISNPKPNLENIYLSNGKLNVPYLVKNGDILFESGDYPLAKNIYKTILKSGEFTSTALYRIGKCLEAENKMDEARSHFEESIAYHPTIDAYQRLAALLVHQNKDQQAAEAMERALKLKDLSQAIRFDLYKSSGNCWTRAQKSEEAERNFKKALEIDPTADEIRANLGALYLQNTKISEAKRHFHDAVASNPKNYNALAGLGSCSLAEGDKKTAHDYFVQSLEIELNNPTTIFYLVKCAYEIKSYATAARLLSEYIQISPINPNLLYSLAGLQFHLGRIAEAKSTTLKILELQSQHPGATDLLSVIQKYAEPAN